MKLRSRSKELNSTKSLCQRSTLKSYCGKCMAVCWIGQQLANSTSAWQFGALNDHEALKKPRCVIQLKICFVGCSILRDPIICQSRLLVHWFLSFHEAPGILLPSHRPSYLQLYQVEFRATEFFWEASNTQIKVIESRACGFFFKTPTTRIKFLASF